MQAMPCAADAVSGADGARSEAGSAASEPAGQMPGIIHYYYTRISSQERLLYDAMLTLAQDAVSDAAREDGERPGAEPDGEKASGGGREGGELPGAGSDGEKASGGSREGGEHPGADTSAEKASGSYRSREEIRLIETDPSSKKFDESYTRAYNALMTDHPELFWIAQGGAHYECRYYHQPTFGGRYKVVFTLDCADIGLYARQQERLESAADALLSQADLSRPPALVALRLHDLLIDSACYSPEAGQDDYAHSAYGALVEDGLGNPGGALCDGYALAYEYLLQRAGITSTMVCGYAGPSDDDTEKHAWNLVLLDGDWYETDPTWNDLDFLLSPSEDGYDLILEALSDEDYMRSIRHYMFNLTTDRMRRFDPGDEYTYSSDNGWVTLLQPSVHIRFSEEEGKTTRDFVTPLAPRAEGTRFTWRDLDGM